MARPEFISWYEVGKGYTREDHLVHAINNSLPQINGRDATYEEIMELYQEKLDKKSKILSMRKSPKKERLLKNWEFHFKHMIFSSATRRTKEIESTLFA